MCHSQRRPSFQSRGLHQSALNLLHTGRKMNQSSRDVTGVQVVLWRTPQLLCQNTFNHPLSKYNASVSHELCSQKNIVFRNARRSLLITNLVRLQSHTACCLLRSCFRAERGCRMSVCADMNQLSDWLAVWAHSTDTSMICDVHLDD